MSENLKPVKININEEEQNKKIVAWGDYGKALYHADLTLQLQAQEIASQLINPTTPDQITNAEQALSVAKKEYRLLQEARLAITSKFDPVLSRLMAHEKNVLEAINKNSTAILQAKQAQKAADKIKELKDKELKEVEKQVTIYVADMHAAYLAAQLKTLSNAYEYALANKITMAALPEFKAKVCARVNLANSATPPPKPIAVHNTQADIDAEVLKHFKPWPAADYVHGFEKDVEAKFSDWEQALQNIEAAKELNQKEVSVTTGAINDQLSKQKLSASLNALSVPVAEQTDTKPLKEVWQIAEPQTVDEMFAIINAFAVNRELVQQYIANIKFGNVGVKQMIAALVKVKTIDVNFECTGITFNKTDKL